MVDRIRELSSELIAEGDLCSWLKLFESLTWHRMGFARERQGLKVYETTITQNLLFELVLLAQLNELPLKILESKSEETNGSDIEIFLESNNGYLLFPCQAKILYKNNSYAAINHKVKEKLQIDLLINYSTHRGGIPLYLFYNYCLDNSTTQHVQSKIPFGIDLFGCSLVNAQLVTDKFVRGTTLSRRYFRRIPTFKDFHPKYAFPLHVLVCEKLRDSDKAVRELFKFNRNYSIRKYKRKEVVDTANWNDLSPMPGIGWLESNRSKQFAKSLLGNPLNQNDTKGENDTLAFQPKFRIVFPLNPEKARISIWS